MLPHPQEHDHVPVYRMLRELGVTRPSVAWKKLLQSPDVQLPEHTLKQFTMRDGRKGRLTPAVHITHQQHLMDLFQKAGLIPEPLQVLPPIERDLLRLLERAFLDQKPHPNWWLDHHCFDLYFEAARLVVQCHSTYRKNPPPCHNPQELHDLLAPMGLQGMWVDPYGEGFEPGDSVYGVRQILEGQARGESSHTS